MTVSTDNLVAALLQADSYPDPCDGDVQLCETHISWVFLAGDYAYKVKKPVRTGFLDYSTLELRERFCREELRLDKRYADDLYLAVVPITVRDGQVRVGHPQPEVKRDDGREQTIEFAVKMRRFPDDALLSTRLALGKLSNDQVQQLAETVAEFHHHAARCDPHLHFGSPHSAIDDMMDNLSDLRAQVTDPNSVATLNELLRWATEYFDDHQLIFSQRRAGGFIRECHGDLHLSNIIQWRGKLTPFDGIEFNEGFRWIDVMSDAAFLSMDFAARGHVEMCRSFTGAYLEQTGDHASLPVLRWYLAYRALVRAKVASIRASQQAADDRAAELEDCYAHIELASRFTMPQRPTLWITHGVSGSGKSTGSELLVQRCGVIRLRSDVERKRHFGLSPLARPDESTRAKLYCDSANQATYGRLRRLAAGILDAGYSVVVDATFLQQHQRARFRNLADTHGASFAILDFDCEPRILRQRITERLAGDRDASDANLAVLEHQLASREPLTKNESQSVAEIPTTVSAIQSL